MHDLIYRSRAPAGAARGALILLHGRGADENDLFPLFDMIDPDRRLVGISLRGPLSLPPGGAHWYQVVRVGYPDPSTFHPTFDALCAWLDEFIAEIEVPMERVVLGGFSQGCVMSYALALANGRPRPAGLIGLSGFIPTVEGLDLRLSELEGWPVAIGHGEFDPVIGVQWGRHARDTLREAGAAVSYRESPMDHTIDPRFMTEVRDWLGAVVP